jgi:peptidylprolyl isomerase
MRLKGASEITRGPLSIAAAVLLAVITAAGCGDNGSLEAFADKGPIPSSPPEVTVPEGLPPKKLVVEELRKGTGAEAKKGDEVMIQYNCVVWEDGAEYANSWRYTKIPTFKLGSHRLLRGLYLTIPGMREGGSREVIIPPHLVYYPGVSHPPVPRLGALICKVYLVKVLDEKHQG